MKAKDLHVRQRVAWRRSKRSEAYAATVVRIGTYTSGGMWHSARCHEVAHENQKVNGATIVIDSNDPDHPGRQLAVPINQLEPLEPALAADQARSEERTRREAALAAERRVNREACVSLVRELIRLGVVPMTEHALNLDHYGPREVTLKGAEALALARILRVRVPTPELPEVH
jgi:hypothetical protein